MSTIDEVKSRIDIVDLVSEAGLNPRRKPNIERDRVVRYEEKG